MPLTTRAQEEIKKLGEIKKRLNPLRERFDEDYKIVRGDEFAMPEEEGKWDNVTSNRLTSECWKIVNILAGAKRKLFIQVMDEKAKERDTITATERLVNSLIYQLDREMDGLPEVSDLQTQMAFYRVVRGWGVYRLLVIDNDDGYPYLDMPVWDIRNTFWIGGKRLHWVCYEQLISLQTAKDQYDYNGKADNNGMIKVLDVLDCSEKGKAAQEGVIIGNEWVRDPEDIKIMGNKLDYLPVRIRAGGPFPLIYDGNDDNIKKVGESYLVNNRILHEKENRLLTFKLTRAGIEAKMPFVLNYNSEKGELPPNIFDKDPYVKGRVITLDEAKGQKIGETIPQAQGNSLELMDARIQRMQNRGGLGEVAFGEYSNVAMTAFGTDILNHNTREHIWPFRQALERDYVWMAGEIARQYKLGGFQKSEFEGYDSKYKRFKTTIKPEDITTDREFECELMVDELKDRSVHSSMAIQEIQAGLISHEEALDVHQLSEDPDRTIDLIKKEMADKAFDTPLFAGLLQKVEDFQKTKDPIRAMELEHAFRILMALDSKQKQELESIVNGGTPEGNGEKSGRMRRLSSRVPQSNVPFENVPAPVREAVRKSQGI